MLIQTATGKTSGFNRPPLQEKWVEINGLPLHLVVSEPDRSVSFIQQAPSKLKPVPVVLVHGLGVSSRYMLPTARRLAPYFPVYAPDLPGFGESGKPRHTLNISQLADVLAELITVTGIEKANFLANSMGCQVVVDLAVRYPALVHKLVLTGPTIDPRHRSSVVEIWRLLRDVPGESLNQLHLALSDYLHCGARVMWQTFQYALHDHLEAKAPEVKIPVLVVRGSHDTIASEGWVELLVNLFPCGQLAVIEGAPHAVTNKTASQLVELVLPFLEQEGDRQSTKEINEPKN